MFRRLYLPWAFAVCLTATHPAIQSGAQEPAEPIDPVVAPASDEGEAALQAFRLDSDLRGSLFAAEPNVANPVAFYVDSRGRVFVCESFRQEQGVTDNRGHSDVWLDADLAAQTVEDRRRYHEEQLGADAVSYTEQDDRIRVLLDKDGDGVAEESHVLADHFNGLVEGTGAGVLEHNGDVYYTCIPNLWRLRDHDGDLKADSREVLHTGYGVRVAFRGHDAHGLRLGPDGRLYFSIGDRGANIETPQGRVKNVESGSVFRCELDGSNLEIFATGLRNPQELAFDEYGNLFTGDNNSDSGDKARWVYVVEGGDSGWRMAYQYLRDRGPFNREQIWHPFHAGQPAYIVPPIANFADGPSGLDYYPGTGFSEAFQGRFFLADFRGTPSQSGVRSFRNEPDGAFFKLVDDEQPIWGMLATDLQFGPDGALYVSDWVNGWNGEGKGRIYRFTSLEQQGKPIIAEVRNLLAESFQELPLERLVELIAHADQRVRLKAQYELAARGERESLARAAADHKHLLGRLHAMWGLEQVARATPALKAAARAQLRSLLDDEQPEIRAQATRLLGDIGGADDLIGAMRARLADESPRVRYFAAQSLGKLKAGEALADIVAMLEANDNHDPVLRHGGVLALSRVATSEELRGLGTHHSVAVRLAAVCGLRRQASDVVAAYLNDADPLVVLEAARAIHDVPIPGAMTALAALIARDSITQTSGDDALVRRVLNANFRGGTAENAQALAAFALRPSASAEMRLEAIEMLGDWQTPRGRDRVLGMWRPLPARDATPVADALRPLVARLDASDAEIRLAVARIASNLRIAEAAPVLLSLISDQSVLATQRADALRSLAKLTGKNGLDAVRAAVADDSEIMRAAGLELLAKYDPTGALPWLVKAAQDGQPSERQAAITALGELGIDQAHEPLIRLMEQLLNDKLAPEVHLETLTAARQQDSDQLRSLLAAYDGKLDPTRPADQYREALHGGDATRGREIFNERASVSCLRCHKIFFRGGEVGPELSRIAADKDRQYLLESIVDPNKTIAKGFESAMVLTDAGQTYVGVVKEETETDLILMDAQANTITIKKDDIELRKPSKSAMPEDVVKQLTKSELRDLVAYLASLDGRRRFRGFNRRTVQ